MYVGTFTRYYQRDWKTIVQQRFPGAKIVRPSAQGDQVEAPNPEEIRHAVIRWRSGLSTALGLEHSWSEEDSKPYFTNKPAWDGFGALLLWAAYDDNGIDPLTRREPVRVDNWTSDPALARYRDLKAETKYPQLLLGEEMWLPIPAPSVFRSVDLFGTQRTFGNCESVLRELELLDRRTWNVIGAVDDERLKNGVENGSSLEAAARFGWEVMHTLAQEAVRHGVPVILDY
ncbi:MAG: hypothetical protein WC718_15205 [Phycisphaerales bacterium]